MDNRKIYEELLGNIEIPRFVKLQSTAKEAILSEPFQAAYLTVKNNPSYQKVSKNSSIAITAGSREISNLPEILLGIIKALKEKGAKPFIIAAMGSHGGATADGQVRVLESYGITEERLGVPIKATMDTMKIGKTSLGESVHLNRIAVLSDYILPVGRIKAHTDFRGKVESGIMKMLVIGLGNQYGASVCHKLGFPNMGDSIWRFGNVIIDNANILMGVGIVENNEHQTVLVEAISAENITKREPELLHYSKSLLPRIPYDNIDILLVQRFGKDISGAGMDPNVTGRSCNIGEFWPNAEKIGVFDLTAASEGNAIGIGNADAITSKIFSQIDFNPMYINSITCRDSAGVRIPVVMETEELVVKYLIHMCIRRDATINPFIVWIKDTTSLKELFVSEALFNRSPKPLNYEILSCPSYPHVNAQGQLLMEEN